MNKEIINAIALILFIFLVLAAARACLPQSTRATDSNPYHEYYCYDAAGQPRAFVYYEKHQHWRERNLVSEDEVIAKGAVAVTHKPVTNKVALRILNKYLSTVDRSRTTRNGKWDGKRIVFYRRSYRPSFFFRGSS